MVTRSDDGWQPSRPRMPRTRWQRELAGAFTRPAELLAFLGLDAALADGSDGPGRAFPCLVPRGFAALMRHGDPTDPLLRQVLPIWREGVHAPGASLDPVADTAARRAPGLLQKYAGRALIIATGACAVHCRYCFRRHYPYGAAAALADGATAALAAIAADTSIEEVILSGGEPLLLDDGRLGALLAGITAIGHVRRLRLHTRVPVVLPARVTTTLCRLLRGTPRPLVVVIHANHPAELGSAAARALGRLRDTGALLLNQGVLLAGVNDDAATLAALAERLFALGVGNYYLHLLDPVQGAAHFDVPEAVACALMTDLRARLPGYLVPRLVREVPGAPGKVPVG